MTTFESIFAKEVPLRDDLVTCVEQMRARLISDKSPVTVYVSQSGQMIFPAFDRDGEFVNHLTFLLHRGDMGNRPSTFSAGVLPHEDMTLDWGSGWIIGSVVIPRDLNPESLGSKLQQRIDEIEKLLTPHPPNESPQGAQA